MSRSGHDANHPLLLVCNLTLQGASGLVTVQTEGRRYTLCMKNGRLLFASANLKRLQVETWLDAAGLLAADFRADPTEGSEGTCNRVDTLVRQGAGTRAEVTTEVQRCLRSIVLEAMSQTDAECAFQKGTPVTRGEITLKDTTRALLLKAATNVPPDIRARLHASLSNASAQAGPTAQAPTPAAPLAGSLRDDELESAAFISPSPQLGADLPDHPATQGVAPGLPALDLSSVEDPALREILATADTADSSTLYELLGVTPDADENAIRIAYYAVARRCHPDIWRGEETDRYRPTVERLFTAVTEAYNRLRRPEEREDYDEEMRAGHRDDNTSRQDPAAVAAENFTQGYRALKAGNLHDAHQFLTNAVRLDPEQGAHHRELGIVQMQNPRWQKAAETSLRRALELQPTDARTLSHLGSLYKKNGLVRRADDLFNRALQWDPDDALALAERSARDDDAESGGLIKGLFGRH